MTSIAVVWRSAPYCVKWPSVLWLLLGLCGIASGLYSLVTFLRIPVTGIVGVAVVQVTFQVGVGSLMMWASWKFLYRSAWARSCLEIASWISLIYFAVIDIIWLVAALLNWDKFTASIASEMPGLHITIKAAVISFAYIVPVVITIIIIKWLRLSKLAYTLKS